jgi:hypothetical protein
MALSRARDIRGAGCHAAVIGVAATLLSFCMPSSQPRMSSAPAPTIDAKPDIHAAFEAARPGETTLCAHDVAAERAVQVVLDKDMASLGGDSKLPLRLALRFDCQPEPASWQLSAVRMHHFNDDAVAMMSIDVHDTDRIAARAIRTVVWEANTSDRQLDVTFDRVVVQGKAAQRALAYARAALATRVTVVQPPSGTYGAGTSDDQDIEMRIGSNGADQSRRWAGFTDSDDEPSRAPLEQAWDALWQLFSDRFEQGPPEESDKRLFALMWAADSGRPEWAHFRLVELAAVLGTPDLARPIARDLDVTTNAEYRTFAVNALASLTGKDLRRDRTGVLRPLDDIVRDYKSLVIH